jgi:hypothetical protein
MNVETIEWKVNDWPIKRCKSEIKANRRRKHEVLNRTCPPIHPASVDRKVGYGQQRASIRATAFQ